MPKPTNDTPEVDPLVTTLTEQRDQSIAAARKVAAAAAKRGALGLDQAARIDGHLADAELADKRLRLLPSRDQL